jgi:hypothetical protein
MAERGMQLCSTPCGLQVQAVNMVCLQLQQLLALLVAQGQLQQQLLLLLVGVVMITQPHRQ